MKQEGYVMRSFSFYRVGEESTNEEACNNGTKAIFTVGSCNPQVARRDLASASCNICPASRRGAGPDAARQQRQPQIPHNTWPRLSECCGHCKSCRARLQYPQSPDLPGRVGVVPMATLLRNIFPPALAKATRRWTRLFARLLSFHDPFYLYMWLCGCITVPRRWPPRY